MAEHEIRKIVRAELEKISEERVAIGLSAGVDSSALLVTLLEIGKNVTAYSFTLERYVSRDFASARENAEKLGVKFVPVFLPRDSETILRDVDELVALGARKKTEVECGWPVLRMIRATEEPVLVVGHGADTHFAISKSAMINNRGSVESTDTYRRSRYNDPNWSQRRLLDSVAAEYGKRVFGPWKADAVCSYFLGRPWDEVNRPRQKETIKAAWQRELSRLRINGAHTNLQMGDSGIARRFETISRELGFTSPIKMYRSRVRSGD